MKVVVIKEIEQLLFRQNVSLKAQFVSFPCPFSLFLPQHIHWVFFSASVSLFSLLVRYYASIFLNQTILTNKEVEVASKLIDVYFSVYRLLVSKGEVETKMLSALLTGINRAFPFAKGSATTK